MFGVAHAFTTRVHLALANEVVAALDRSGDGTLPLRGGDRAVRWAPADARAITRHPEAFRAGAISPDNFVFPAMTDQTHGLGLRPYDQCTDLVALADDDEERAYALGCLLHGATDAIAHHYVNWLTGETFTLHPLSAGRAESYDNVVRHIVAESMLQDALLAEDPAVFSAEATAHTIPSAFVQRALLSTGSPAWQRMATHALPAWEAARAADPDASFVVTLAALDLAPSEMAVLLPVYLSAFDDEITALGPTLEARAAELQDPGTADGAALGVTAGPDGLLGSPDDETACDLTCPALATEYFLVVAMLEPRTDPATGAPLPPAWVSFTDELRADLATLPAAYVETVAALSATLSGPLAAGDDPVDAVAVAAAFAPLDAWVVRFVTIDTDAVAEAVLPQWLLDLVGFLAAFGLPVDLGALLDLLLAPVVNPIRDAVRDEIVATLHDELETILTAVDAQEDDVSAEFRARIEAAAPAGGDGTLLDHPRDSGLWVTAFNLAVVTIAQPGVIVPIADDWEGVGGASFDASHTWSWTQAAACPALGAVVAPYGADVSGLLSLEREGVVQRAQATDAPVECHDGALDAFTDDPDARTCALTALEDLVARPVGSLTRAFPPAVVDAAPACRDLAVPGLDLGGATGTPPGPTAPGTDPAIATEAAAGGCGCDAVGSGPAALAGAALAVLARRRRP